MALFTAETARLAAAKSHEAIRLKKLAAIHPPQPQGLPPLTAAIADIELSRVRSRLDTLDRLMAAAETDREWDNLSRAYERVFRAWVHLAGIPGPGQRRPGRERRQDQAQAQPLVAPTPQPIVCPVPTPEPATTLEPKSLPVNDLPKT